MTGKEKIYAFKNDGRYICFWSTGTNGDYATDKKSVVGPVGGSTVELVEKPKKVVLPREVGEELDDWMADNQDEWGGRIGDLIDDITNNEPELIHVVDFVGYYSEENYFKIIDAYRYGWEAEKESLYNVKAEIQHVLTTFWFFVNADGTLDVTHDKRKAKQFSILEIDRYGLQNYECVEVTGNAD